MKRRTPLDETICSILAGCRRIAVVGLSNKPWRDSRRVARHLIENSYEVVPVNPELTEVMGLKCYPDLRAGQGTALNAARVQRSDSSSCRKT